MSFSWFYCQHTEQLACQEPALHGSKQFLVQGLGLVLGSGSSSQAAVVWGGSYHMTRDGTCKGSYVSWVSHGPMFPMVLCPHDIFVFPHDGTWQTALVPCGTMSQWYIWYVMEHDKGSYVSELWLLRIVVLRQVSQVCFIWHGLLWELFKCLNSLKR